MKTFSRYCRLARVLVCGGLAAASAGSASARDSCETTACKPGDVVIVHSPKNDQAIACVTKALQRYVGMVIGFAGVQAAVGITPAKEFDLTGDTKKVVDQFRSEAGVRDVEQAIPACKFPKHAQRVTILEQDPPYGSTLVSPADGSSKFWIDRAALSPRR